MKTTTTETMSYDEKTGLLVQKVTVVESDDPTGPVNVVQHIHNPEPEGLPEWVKRHAR